MNTTLLLICLALQMQQTTTIMHLPDGGACTVSLGTDYVSVYQLGKKDGLCFTINGERKGDKLKQYHGTATVSYKFIEEKLVFLEIKASNKIITLKK